MPSRSKVVRIPRADPLALQAAAYVMTKDAYVVMGKDSVTLAPKRGVKAAALGAAFKKEYGSQLLRWSLLRAGRADRLAGERKAPKDAAISATPGLDAARRAEIARLLAESEAAPKDPLGIRTTWAEMRARR